MIVVLGKHGQATNRGNIKTGSNGWNIFLEKIFFLLSTICTQLHICKNIKIPKFFSDIMCEGILLRDCICLEQVVVICRIMNKLLKVQGRVIIHLQIFKNTAQTLYHIVVKLLLFK